MLSFGVTTGSRLPAYCTSMGRVLLAGLAAAQLDAYLAAVQPRKFTSKTVVDVAALRRVLERDRKRGYSIVSGELEERLTGVSVPVRDRHGTTIAALNASVLRPVKSEAELLRSMLPRLQRTAEKMGASAEFGL
jgi:IclR family pca regulon transcriptional regulator